MIVIDDEGGHIAHVGRYRIAEHHQLDQRRDKDHAHQPRVAQHLQEFLAHDLENPLEALHHCGNSLRKARMASATPMNAKAIISSPCTYSASTPTPLRNTPRVTTMK